MVERRSLMALALALLAAALAAPCFAGDPYAYFDWDVSFITAAPLGVKQQIAFQESGLPSLSTLHMKKTAYFLVRISFSSVDLSASPCAGWCKFQVKDQIGSFFYFPSINFQRAGGGYGGFTVNNRDVIAVPFDKPDGDITLFIGDWYKKDYKVHAIKQSQHNPDMSISYKKHRFVKLMDYGEWTEESRGTYNKGDGVARCSTQVLSWNFTSTT
ncbi:hypothetical protein BHE74_00056354 [Ensete ventricosum]|uniref:Plastocyanin-like domain-containing protein n=1 Tax=Ensete ventricosum TaxID=4639 RepID=A0A445MHS3_ENSVE|nr:hypothetical protein BHE74_00056354 [Ensete ventricosum]RZR73834.1 hypothetical protein BHM03_00028654 [Ensete ventricosum]